MGSLQELLDRVRDLFRWWVVVAPWEQAVRVLWGKNPQLLKAGIHLRIPFLHRVYLQSVRKRVVFVPGQIVSTKDGHPISVSSAVSFRIEDLLLLYDTLHNANEQVKFEAMARTVGFIQERRKEEVGAKALAEELRARLYMRGCGLEILDVSMTDFACLRSYRIINTGLSDDRFTRDELDDMSRHLFERGQAAGSVA